ncbi:putative transferase protein [uncultured Defluviicoccus sp.]|uniref:Putative transferase protein n=1 Tax=metagenome TaxID=256318 RepID=A0A380TKV9_9ZZZZ|nr:putative transferase protein [uncultured Defluviicoccus sp.]
MTHLRRLRFAHRLIQRQPTAGTKRAPSARSTTRILMNFSALKQGGGQNVAMNFLYAVVRDPSLLKGFELDYIVARNSSPHKYLSGMPGTRVYVFSRNPLIRVFQELFWGSYIVALGKYDAIYSYFGSALFFGQTPQVCGCAMSNLFFPEVDFWQYYRGITRIGKHIVDYYRLWGLKRAASVVFETNIIEKRAKTLHKLRETKVILPSIALPQNNAFTPIICFTPDIAKGLFFCGWQPNKNVFLIPEIAASLRQCGVRFQFIVTAPRDGSAHHRRFERLVREKSVEEMVEIVGPISKDEIPYLYESISVVFLLSKLESFSNNILESWYYSKPMIVSDEIWARSICGDAAVYVDRNSAEEIAGKVAALLDNLALRAEVVNRGREALATYPSIDARVAQEMAYVRYISQIH